MKGVISVLQKVRKNPGGLSDVYMNLLEIRQPMSSAIEKVQIQCPCCQMPKMCQGMCSFTSIIFSQTLCVAYLTKKGMETMRGEATCPGSEGQL